MEFESNSGNAIKPYRKNFGSWQNTLAQFKDWLQKNDPTSNIVEAIKTGFPDCVGKRLIDKNKNLWEPVFIEFEYKSKNLLAHGHDASKCDVIVCWIHDWADCPIEVIELKNIVTAGRFY